MCIKYTHTYCTCTLCIIIKFYTYCTCTLQYNNVHVSNKTKHWLGQIWNFEHEKYMHIQYMHAQYMYMHTVHAIRWTHCWLAISAISKLNGKHENKTTNMNATSAHVWRATHVTLLSVLLLIMTLFLVSVCFSKSFARSLTDCEPGRTLRRENES